MIQMFLLLWLINLGCIDLNQWYATCDDVDRPDYLHFDLDPVPGANFKKVVEAALLIREALESLKISCYAKTTGSKGIHVYVPIVRGPTQKQVWGFAKEFAHALAAQAPKLLTAVYKVSNRPKGRVLVDYNQNSWGRTLASIYSIRPTPRASVSTPVTWSEVEKGIKIDDFRIDNVPARVRKLGDLWKPLLARIRFKLEAYFKALREVNAAQRLAWTALLLPGGKVCFLEPNRFGWIWMWRSTKVVSTCRKALLHRGGKLRGKPPFEYHSGGGKKELPEH